MTKIAENRIVERKVRINNALTGLTTSSAIFEIGGTEAPQSADTTMRMIDLCFGCMVQIIASGDDETCIEHQSTLTCRVGHDGVQVKLLDHGDITHEL